MRNDREVGVTAAVLVTGSEKAAAQLVWTLAPRLPEPDDVLQDRRASLAARRVTGPRTS